MFLRKLAVINIFMEVIIDFDKIKDPTKREWLINSLKLMKIGFHTSEKPQTIAQYNSDLEKGEAEIEKGEFTTAEALKAEAKKW
jgi:hypothetical protein